MRTPNGIRAESTRTPNASRAGALHSHSHSHIHLHRDACVPIHLQTAPARLGDQRRAAATRAGDAWMAADAAEDGWSR